MAVVEKSQVAASIPFDDSILVLGVTNIQTALEALNNKITVSTSGNNFSFRNVLSGVTVIVPPEQQMLNYQEIEIQNTGELIIDGEVVIFE